MNTLHDYCEMVSSGSLDPAPALLAYDAVAIGKLDLWIRSGNAGNFPFEVVVDAFHEVGKHFVDQELLIKLSQARQRVIKRVQAEPQSPYESILAFLNVALDKRDQTYDYRSYLALNLLNIPTDDTSTALVHVARRELDRMIIILVADILQFELGAMDGYFRWLPEIPSTPELVEKRCSLALKALGPFLQRNSFIPFRTDKSQDASISVCRALCASVERTITLDERDRLLRSMLPVYLVHDEYLFIRVLQCFESTFAWMTVHLRAALSAFERHAETVANEIRTCQDYLREAAVLFQLLATMRPDAFRIFRQYTEGASAIQSRNYKKVESLCRRPDEARLNSIAYESVPDVRNKLLDGHPNLDDAYHLAQREQRFSAAEFDRIRQEMLAFEVCLKRWRHSHYGIAVRMLGEGTGTGYTEGTPYLNQVRTIPVFRAIHSD